ncbi:hypothetical protein FE784_03165 [Paenibacillus hemerocallicola]|uniref:Heparinase n=1 Tax=Paenibacillus hemerocallicola TaxID=1172614 RepID=A0A5C4TF52_9BACL|nr:hypothetical protein [Paenibacillus hemerocallicola]TNJ67764.1 hypothetical protein FE784_03165 [Paenibacillus hemerocallicola]
MLTQKDLVRDLENRWDTLKAFVIGDPESHWYGTLDPATGKQQDIINLAACLYCHSESRWYKKPAMLEVLEKAINYLLRSQLPSGCISLENCNIDSPPDTAFTVHVVSLVYKLVRHVKFQELVPAERQIELFLRRSIDGLLHGGFHTPNHRWVLCGALALLYELFDDKRLKDRAFQFLNEGFDITPDGEWTERSNGTYNPICDLLLYHAGTAFGHEQAFAAIRSNLNMMRYLLHPDNSVATEYSSRGDRDQVVYLNGMYNAIYRLMANRDKNETFHRMAAIASETVSSVDPILLLYWMLYPADMELNESVGPLADKYTVLLHDNHSVDVPMSINNTGRQEPDLHGASILRHRRGKLSVTLMAGQQHFMYIQYGKTRMVAAKLALGWFGIGSVSFPAIRRTGENEYELHVEPIGSYGGILTEEQLLANAGNLSHVPYQLREKTNVLVLPIRMKITIAESAIRLEVSTDAIPHLFAQMLFAFDSKGEIEGSGLRQATPQFYHLTEGEATYRCGPDRLVVSPGMNEHRFETMRNDKQIEGAIALGINCVTPLNKTFQISWGEDGTEEILLTEGANMPNNEGVGI